MQSLWRPDAVHEDWNNPPDYHKDCEWYEKSCDICGGDLKVHRSWTNVPRSHRDCLKSFAPKDINCSQCGKSFTISTRLRLKCREEDRALPNRCRQCDEGF